METPLPNTWNMFRRRDEGELWCAVPASEAVTRFLFSGDWDFGGQHAEWQPVTGFKTTLAHQSVRMNGFYLFHLVSAEFRGAVAP